MNKTLPISLILFLIFTLPVYPSDAAPFPLNQGTIYEHNSENLPYVNFFPKEKARWDPEKVSAEAWKLLTDYQKSMFVAEFLELLDKRYGTVTEINGWEYLIALNNYSSSCSILCSTTPMYYVLDTLLFDNGVIAQHFEGLEFDEG